MTTEEIRDGRLRYKDDIIQPFRGDKLSKEFVKKYPDKVNQMLKEGNINKADIRNATNVWNDLGFYKGE